MSRYGNYCDSCYIAMYREKSKRRESTRSFVLALVTIFILSLVAFMLAQIVYSFYLDTLCKKTCGNYNYTLEGKCCYCLFGNREVVSQSWRWCR